MLDLASTTRRALLSASLGHRRRVLAPWRARNPWTTRSSTCSPRGPSPAIRSPSCSTPTSSPPSSARRSPSSSTSPRPRSLRAHRARRRLPGADLHRRSPSCPSPVTPASGAAHTLVRTGRLPAGTLRQECGAGVLDVVVDDDGATLTGGRPTLEDGPAGRGLAAGDGASSAADATGVPAHVAGCGLPFTYLACGRAWSTGPCPTRAALDALGVGEGVSVLSWDAGDRRPPTPASSPATCAGTRTRPPARPRWAPASGWSRAGLLPADGTSSYVVRQGEKMGRPVGADLHGDGGAAGGP